MAIPTVSMATLAASKRGMIFDRVLYIRDPNNTDPFRLLSDDSRTLVCNISAFIDEASAGKFKNTAIEANSIAAAQIAANAIETAELAAGAVTGAKTVVMDDPGHLANGVLRASGNYADGETITIGTDVFEIDPITTDSTDTCKNGSWNNTTDPLTITLGAADYPVISPSGTGPLAVGHVVYIGTEYLRVTVVDGDAVTFARAQGGSTAAAHVDTTAIYVSASAPTNISVGIQAVLTPAAVSPILAATINDDAGTAGQANDVTATSLASGAVVLIVADAVGAVVLATTETGTNLA